MDIASIKARLERAKKRLDQSETDGEYEANRQVIIWLEAQIAGRRAA